MKGINENFSVKFFHLSDDGTFPNSQLPVLLYKNIFDLPFLSASSYIQKLFKLNNWNNSWKDGIYDYQHYHSITHEVLGFYKGKTKLLLGGENGIDVIIEKGDVLIIPAGVAHKNLHSKNAISCVGAYPDGKNYDMNYGKNGERPQTDINISKIYLPSKDPVFGLTEGIKKFWKIYEPVTSGNNIYNDILLK